MKFWILGPKDTISFSGLANAYTFIVAQIVENVNSCYGYLADLGNFEER